MLESDEDVEIFGCTYTAVDGEFTIEDVECTEGVGRYTYSLTGDTLSFSLVADRCEDRGLALASSWSRE